jgi:hypothetical protein
VASDQLCLLALLFTQKDEGDTFLQNIHGLLLDCMALLSAFFVVTAVRISNLIDIKYLFELFEVSEYFTEYNGNRM